MSRRSTLLLVLVLALGALFQASLADARFTVLEETRVSVKVRLSYHVPGQDAVVVMETLAGKAGTNLTFARQLGDDASGVAVGLLLSVQPESGKPMARLTLESDTRALAGGKLHEVRRTLDAVRDRLVLVDVYGESGARLVVGLVPSWETVPVVSALEPGGQPVDFVLEILESAEPAPFVIERHRLSSLIGSPVSYVYEHRQQGPAEAAATGAATGPLRFEVTLEPRAIEADLVTLVIRLKHKSERKDASLPTLDSTLSERLGPGHSLDVPLPRSASGPGLIVRVTPFF